MATCLYKPKPCDVCGKVIPIGAECEYIEATKGVRHYGCEPAEEPPGPEIYALSQRLGFLSFDASLHWHWSQMRGEGQRTLWAREE